LHLFNRKTLILTSTCYTQCLDFTPQELSFAYMPRNYIINELIIIFIRGEIHTKYFSTDQTFVLAALSPI